LKLVVLNGIILTEQQNEKAVEGSGHGLLRFYLKELIQMHIKIVPQPGFKLGTPEYKPEILLLQQTLCKWQDVCMMLFACGVFLISAFGHV
jgi:hypothetical protein